jgi:polyvinyl alcohol dehydrogenase (cytochrome)
LAVLCAAGSLHAAAAEENACATAAGPVAIGAAQWNGWGQDLDNSRYQSEPAMRAVDVTKLAVKWAYGIGGNASFGQPAVIDGRLFVTSSAGRVYSLDSRTGCTYWTFDAATATRTGVSIGELSRPPKAVRLKRTVAKLAHLDVAKGPSAAFFGDDGGTVYALDAQKGTLLWRVQVDTHPLARIAATPTPYQSRLYVAVSSGEEAKAASPDYPCCTFRGSVVALDMATGHVLWKTYTITDAAQPTGTNAAGLQGFGPAGAAISTSPTIDTKRNALYVGTGHSFGGPRARMADAVVALDLIDGSVRWVEQPQAEGNPGAAGFGGAVILRTLPNGNPIILATQDSGIVSGLDPDRAGEIRWQSKANDAAVAGGELNAAADHRSLYVATSPGDFAALDIKTGSRRWHVPVPPTACAGTDQNCTHAPGSAMAVMPGIAFSGSMDGHLRAYSSIDGKIVWDFDTARDFQTVNRFSARGGSLSGGGAAIVDGIVYVPGNVLLAFSMNGK